MSARDEARGCRRRSTSSAMFRRSPRSGMSGSKSYLILALNDRDRTIADWRERQGTDWVDQMLLGGMLKCAEYGYRMIFELVDTHSDHVERELERDHRRASAGRRHPDAAARRKSADHQPAWRARASPSRASARTSGAGDRDDDGRRACRARWRPRISPTSVTGASASSPARRNIRSATGASAGWKAEMERRGLATDGLIAQGDFSYRIRRGRRPDAAFVRRIPPTAIIASNDRMALACLAVARERGLDVPARSFAGQLRQHAHRPFHPAAAHRHRPAGRRNRFSRGRTHHSQLSGAKTRLASRSSLRPRSWSANRQHRHGDQRAVAEPKAARILPVALRYCVGRRRCRLRPIPDHPAAGPGGSDGG